MEETTKISVLGNFIQIEILLQYQSSLLPRYITIIRSISQKQNKEKNLALRLNYFQFFPNYEQCVQCIICIICLFVCF